MKDEESRHPSAFRLPMWLPNVRRAEQTMGMPAALRRRWTLAEVRRLIDATPEPTPRFELVAVPYAEARRLDTEMPARSLILVIEVISPNSALGDRGPKRELYQRHVPEYWIVDLDAQLFERWLPGDDRSEIAREQIEWHPAGASTPFTLDLPAYFARVVGARP